MHSTFGGSMMSTKSVLASNQPVQPCKVSDTHDLNPIKKLFSSLVTVTVTLDVRFIIKEVQQVGGNHANLFEDDHVERLPSISDDPAPRMNRLDSSLLAKSKVAVNRVGANFRTKIVRSHASRSKDNYMPINRLVQPFYNLPHDHCLAGASTSSDENVLSFLYKFKGMLLLLIQRQFIRRCILDQLLRRHILQEHRRRITKHCKMNKTRHNSSTSIDMCCIHVLTEENRCSHFQCDEVLNRKHKVSNFQIPPFNNGQTTTITISVINFVAKKSARLGFCRQQCKTSPILPCHVLVPAIYDCWDNAVGKIHRVIASFKQLYHQGAVPPTQMYFI